MTEQPEPVHGCTIGGQPAMPILVSEYNQLVADLAALRAVARGYCPACGRGDAGPTVADYEQQRQRAGRAVALLHDILYTSQITGDRIAEWRSILDNLTDKEN